MDTSGGASAVDEQTAADGGAALASYAGGSGSLIDYLNIEDVLSNAPLAMQLPSGM